MFILPIPLYSRYNFSGCMSFGVKSLIDPQKVSIPYLLLSVISVDYWIELFNWKDKIEKMFFKNRN